MNPKQIAEEAATEIVKARYSHENHFTVLVSNIIQAAIEKDRGEMWNTVDCQRREIERLRKLVESRAAHASEVKADTKRLLKEAQKYVARCIGEGTPDESDAAFKLTQAIDAEMSQAKEKQMNTKQIAEELAEKWNFCAELEADVTAAIEKATKPLRNEITMWEKKRDLWVEEREALSLATPEAAESRAAHASEPITELVEALRMLRDFQNGCPLPSYEKGWNEAIRLTDDALRKYEPQSAAHASEKYKHDVRESHGAQ